MRWRRYGEHAALLDCASLEEMSAARATLTEAALDGVTEIVPGARTLLVVASTSALEAARSLLASADLDHPPAGDAREVVLDVRYSGEDLSLVAEDAGLSVAEVVALHTRAVYTVAFTGFAPGFGYLAGLPAELQQSRLSSPRTRVPAGSVAIADEYTGVYPRESPGGWRLIGHTEVTLFEPSAAQPALFTPGLRVRFRSV
ncbi:MULTISPECIES: 5-oxoprolinase subunit B family protein [Amycolatopsis]|uniref:Allophanate hydrolase subunit 1 n=1 Tax=Amycolatopsis dendrobii TaxID=2760662 RepID=A0A7W3ZCB1_9PSEU|nr:MULTISPECIES: allophanate hydrolase subunit 1 [Amycolatopsis]MBB1155713.1 allophanate hydrolase subunit 1 [Amycolatopsis dendrobii]UKD52917.1 allophanate hydrolase subunit 1 [Amycolatopsis sp. FU40]